MISFQDKINKQIEEYKKLIKDHEIKETENLVYLKYLNLVKEKFNFEDFLSQEDILVNQINSFIDEFKLNKQKVEQTSAQWSDDINSKNESIKKLKDEVNDSILKLNEKEEMIKKLTTQLETAFKFEENCLDLEKDKEKLLADAKISEEKIKKFSKKIEIVKSSLDKSKITEEKLLKSENDKIELEIKIVNLINNSNSEFDAKTQVINI